MISTTAVNPLTTHHPHRAAGPASELPVPSERLRALLSLAQRPARSPQQLFEAYARAGRAYTGLAGGGVFVEGPGAPEGDPVALDVASARSNPGPADDGGAPSPAPSARQARELRRVLSDGQPVAWRAAAQGRREVLVAAPIHARLTFRGVLAFFGTSDREPRAELEFVLLAAEAMGRALASLESEMADSSGAAPPPGERFSGTTGPRPRADLLPSPDLAKTDASAGGIEMLSAAGRETSTFEASGPWSALPAGSDPRFLARASHELRTPLTALHGALALLRESEDELPPDLVELVDLASRGSDRLRRIVIDVLDILRLELRSIPLDRRPTSLLHIADQVVERRRALANRSGITARVQGAVDACGQVDATWIERAVDQLLLNALDHAPVGSQVDISVALRNRKVTCTVTDRGAGVPEGFRSRLFGKFEQARPAESRRRDRVGLGLALTRAIVEAHDGAVTIHNLPSGGAQVRFWVPAAGLATAHEGGA